MSDISGPMRKIIDRIYVGGDEGVEKAKERGFSRLCACKDGPDGHRAMLGYTTLAAPHDAEYLFASRGHVGAMNVVDNDDVSMISDEVVRKALRWVKKEWDAGRTIYFHCNHGHERGPVMAMMFMRTIGEMPYPFTVAKRIFHSLYERLDMRGSGMLYKARELWKELPGLYGGQEKA